MFQSCASEVTTFVTNTCSKINVHPKEPIQGFFSAGTDSFSNVQTNSSMSCGIQIESGHNLRWLHRPGGRKMNISFTERTT